VIAFNTSEAWARNVSEVVARELQQRFADQMRELPARLQRFVEQYGGPADRESREHTIV
jgi:hypothetical protein